jgi:predicted dinucleotide-utilizing enzyme
MSYSDLPIGCHLIVVNRDGTHYRYDITPEWAPLIAAGVYAEDKLSRAIMEATDMRPSRTLLTSGQIEAWDILAKELGDEKHALTWPSAKEASEKAIQALIAESEKLMYNPTIKKAYDNFMLTVNLSYQGEENDHN